MKKFLSLLLTLTMMLSLCTVAFAANGEATITDVTEGSNTASFDVTATANVTGDNYADIAYSVKVAWTVGTFDLDIDNSALYTWDAATLKYVKATPAADDFATKTVDATITLTNSSNAAVNYAIAYTDNGSDNMTTSEAAKEGSSKTGKLDNADTCGAATAAPEDIEHDYAIAADKLAQGSAKTASYAGTVSLTALGDTTAITNGSTLKLGTYTVTLSAAPAAPTFSTIADIIATVPNFPTTPETGWKAAENPDKLVYTSTGVTTAVVIASSRILLSEPVTQEGSNYKLVYSAFGITTTVTFFMTNNKLTSITATIENSKLGTTENYTFTAPTN